MRIGDKKRRGDGSSVEEARCVGLHGRRHEDGAIVGIDIERLADFHLLDIDAFADANFVAGRGGVDGVLDVREARIRTLNFIVIHDQPSAVGRQGHGRPNER